jgi:hypothetical protein
MARQSEMLEFETSHFDKEVVEIILRNSKFPGRSAAINAVRNLNLAWRLRSVDAQIAMLRSITAKEEAATALFRALKKHKYSDAEKVNPRDHLHKNAVLLFVESVARVWHTYEHAFPSFAVVIEAAETAQANLRLVFGYRSLEGEPLFVWPSPPLNFEVGRLSLDTGTLDREDFQRGVDEVIRDRGVSQILKILRSCANDRNLLLYASEQGAPVTPSDIDQQLRDHQWAVLFILKLYLMIAPYHQKQLFVEQALLAFVKMTSRSDAAPPSVA